jgi:hypothetical protein
MPVMTNIRDIGHPPPSVETDGYAVPNPLKAGSIAHR